MLCKYSMFVSSFHFIFIFPIDFLLKTFDITNIYFFKRKSSTLVKLSSHSQFNDLSKELNVSDEVSGLGMIISIMLMQTLLSHRVQYMFNTNEVWLCKLSGKIS